MLLAWNGGIRAAYAATRRRLRGGPTPEPPKDEPPQPQGDPGDGWAAMVGVLLFIALFVFIAHM